MRRTNTILSILLLVLSLFMIVLYGASGHAVNTKNPGTVIYIGLFVIYLLTAVVLVVFNRKGGELYRKGAIVLTFASLLSIFYFFYEILKVPIGDYAAFIPILLLMVIVFFCIRVLNNLMSNKF